MHFTTSADFRLSVKKALSNKAETAILYDSPDKEHHLNDFILFMKPEITSQIRFDHFIELFSAVTDKMASHRIKINQIHLLSAAYLSKNHIIEEHYKTIHDAAKDPLSSFTSKAKDTFTQVFGMRPEEANVFGAFEMLKKHPGMDPHQLNDIWQDHAFQKLDSGIYCSKIQVDSREIFLVNGFAPKQIVYFTGDNRFIILFDLSSGMDWRIIRQDFCGPTMPSQAKKGSLRHYLYTNKKNYHTEINISKNGVHVSAGPVEGLKEKMHFLQINDPGTIPFGTRLLQHFSRDEVNGIFSNPLINIDDSVISVFNFTEDLNSDDALELLMKYYLQR